MNKQFKFIDLFSGIGGFHYGLAQCGGQCVLASDIDSSARKTYEINFGIQPAGDICELKSNEIPEFDLLCAGFPCQSFSNIGTKRGLKDPRGALIYEVIRILNDCSPKAFILENVKGLLTHDKGNTFRIIKSLLENCEYNVFYNILEAKDYGVPQIRKRLFIVGIKKEYDIKFNYPKPTGCIKKLSDILGGDTEREYSFTIRIGGRRSGIDNRFNWDCYNVNGQPHYLQVEECLELQGFPRDFHLFGNQSEKFKQVGNAVPTVIVRALGEELIKTKIFSL
ncbi:DNA (cytosine-5)-methyltransferase 1 [Tissierella praeacuta DSM 18095]|uniref:Cytosine-specific methyltransferase n=1 Tax=Tissierella praeacuta DSM 18095 TaxID=1123404 RepID=A0A1M4XA19_9FIRM|nr:DNA cytosine methyltransferase [Tissierella praeacuta]SHE90330.1 DNA (cytosine-5)-methyltransferase 1 [Tissierella praeacuta DSM 18095]SUP02565.1 Modification methylase HhaI [Tissierella praeacuta]